MVEVSLDLQVSAALALLIMAPYRVGAEVHQLDQAAVLGVNEDDALYEVRQFRTSEGRVAGNRDREGDPTLSGFFDQLLQFSVLASLLSIHDHHSCRPFS